MRGLIIILVIILLAVIFTREQFSSEDRRSFTCKHGLCYRCSRGGYADPFHPWYLDKCVDEKGSYQADVVAEHDLWGNIFESNC